MCSGGKWWKVVSGKQRQCQNLLKPTEHGGEIHVNRTSLPSDTRLGKTNQALDAVDSSLASSRGLSQFGSWK